ncbi:2'-5' RNA ligase family protein [Thermomonas aquatica]|uniref:2'-5' RNA ligase family protein n=1 Tax=Thermomonas aquatica TaxID=2202149 RepID=A0A5B7ZP64_9GAMM|nr:2'-5' RNA ligase family protein [Thermomonas aquatica]QDA56529.1 2'-5' RNA ligase family protein [Thermomonas aquatica]
MAKDAPSRPTRRQLSLLVPEEQRAIVEPIRQRLDPIQYSLIPAHVTLCRDNELPELRILKRRLERLEAFSFTMAFGEPQELSDGCVLLRPTTGVEHFQALRRSILGPDATAQGAHLTLLHPRNATGAIHNLESLARKLSGLEIRFKTIAIIEQRGCDPWTVKNEYRSAI